MRAAGALQQQAILTVRALVIGRVFLGVDLTRVFDVANRNGSRILDIEMRRFGGL
jgi:hypothetical protein